MFVLAGEFFHNFWLDDADVWQVPVQTSEVHAIADNEFVANVRAVVFNFHFGRPASSLVQQHATLN